MGINHPELSLMDPSSDPTNVIETIQKDVPDNILLQGRFDSGVLLSYQMQAGEAFPGDFGCRWVINGTTGDIMLTNPRGTFDIEHEGILIKLREAGAKKAQTIELAKDELSELKHPAQNVGRLYEAFSKGDIESYADWKVALKMHEFIDEMFRRSDEDRPFA
jgi:predicted dehydrogenase